MSMAEQAGNQTMSGTDAMPSTDAMAALIARLVQKYGRELMSDRRRLLGLMRDYEPTQALAIRLLMGAYDQDVPQIFLSGDAGRADFAIEHAVQSLVQETGIKSELAQWSVECWQKALAAAPAAVLPIAGATAPAPPVAAAPLLPGEPPIPVIDPVTLPIGDARMPEPTRSATIEPEPAPAAIASTGASAKPPAEALTWGESDVAVPPATPEIPVAPPAIIIATAPVPPVAPPAIPVAPVATVAPPPPLAMAPSAPPLAPLAPPAPAADLTWGESEVITPAATPIPMAPTVPIAPAIPLAPSMAPPSATPPAFAQQTATPPPGGFPPGGLPPGMTLPPASNKFGGANLGYIITALVVIVGAAAYRFDLFGTQGTAPRAPAPQTTPQAPPKIAAPAPQKAPAQEEITVIKVLTDPSNIASWPMFPAGTRLGNAVNSWQFKFNMKYLDGRTFVYSASFLFSTNLREGKGVVSAVDLRQNTDAMVSQTPALPVTRARVNSGQAYLTSIQTTGWDQNPSNAPSVCISFTSGQTAARFEPEQTLFCVNDYKNKTCGVVLGCGRLE